MRKPKISFFQNIYYWFWYYTPKKRITRRFSPPMFASGLFSATRILIFAFITVLLLAIFGISLFNSFKEIDRVSIGFVSLLLASILIKIDDRYYLSRHDLIINKFKNLKKKELLIKRIIFFIYISATIGSFCLIPWLRGLNSSQEEPKQYAAPQGKVQTNEKGEVFILDNNGDTIPLKLKD